MTTRRQLDRSWLRDAPPDKVFWCSDGRVMKNLDELVVALQDMTEETFRYHADGQKNDFSNWVRDVIGDDTLAKDLAQSTTSVRAARKVQARLARLKKSPQV